MGPEMNQTNRDQGTQEGRHPGATHSAPPSAHDLSFLTHPTKEPKQDTSQTSATTTAEPPRSTDAQFPRALPLSSLFNGSEGVPAFDRVGFSSLLAEIRDASLLGKVGRVALGAIPMMGVVVCSVGEVAAAVSLLTGLVGSGSGAALAGGLLLGGGAGFLAASFIGRIADEGCHMVRRVFGNTDSYADALDRAGEHTDSLLDYILRILDR